MANSSLAKHPNLKVYLFIVIGVLLFFYVDYAINPAGRAAIVAEDSLLEDLTALFYFAAFFIGLWYWHSRKISLFIPLLSLLGGLEEIAYGERWLGFKPTSLTGINLNVLHSIPEMVPYHIKVFAIVFIVACALLFSLIYLKLLPLQKMIGFGKKLLANQYFIFFLLFIVPAETIDLFHIPLWTVLIEETFELGASISLFFAVRQVAHDQERKEVIVAAQKNSK